VIKRGVIIGIGTIILVIGLTGLGLLQTEGIRPTKVISPEPAPAISQESQCPVNQTASTAVAAPQSKVGPGTQTGADLSQGAVPEQHPPSGDLAAEKPVPVPQVGKDERLNPKQDQVALPRPSPVQIQSGLSQDDKSTGKPRFDEKLKQAHLKSESQSYPRKAPPAQSGQPVVIKFNFDPARHRALKVAQVHSGDRIRVTVERVGQVDRKVRFTFSRHINSPQGSVLKVETMHSFSRPVTYPPDRGYYVIEVKIYPGNRWNIKPRSFV